MKKWPAFIFFFCAASFLILFVNPQPVAAFWRYRCIDTMKESRDRAQEWSKRKDAQDLIRKELMLIKSLGGNCVSVATPYDEEFVPILALWVGQAKELGLIVWFRGNFSGWEGWFDYSKFTDVREHHRQTYELITKHQQLFKNGDIFTPAPEPENGIIGDPRATGEHDTFLQFLTDSYDNCIAAFAIIQKSVTCGYFSTNGDVAAQILTKETVSKIGNVVVIDHYVSDSERFERDIRQLHDKLGAPIVLGELGSPIPDIHGPQSEREQAEFIDKLFRILYKHRSLIPAVNYWVLSGGTTAIVDEKGNLREGAHVVRNYFKPTTIVGQVRNSLGESLNNTRIVVGEGIAETTTDGTGKFSVAVPGGSHRVTVENDTYAKATQVFDIPAGDTLSLKVTLQPKDASFIYRFRKFLAELLIQFPPKISL